MKIYDDIYDLSDFKPWSGAVDTYNKLIEADKSEEFISQLDDVYPDGVSHTQLNDLLWFESEWCYSLVGLNAYGVEPISASDLISECHEQIADAIDHYVCEYISEHERFCREDFSSIEPSDFESEIDDWLEKNQYDKTDMDELINFWLDDVGEEIIKETVDSWLD